MKPLPLAALAAAASLTTLIALDIVWNAGSSELGPWVDPERFPALARVTIVVHAVLYVLLASALITYGRAIDMGRRFVGVIRWTIAAGYGIFATLFTWLAFNPTFDTEGVVSILSTVAFAVTLIVPIVLGFAVVRRREFRVAAILLTAPVVVLPMVMVLEAFTEWAHPGYLETVVNVGVALLCVAASAQDLAPASAPAALIRTAPAAPVVADGSGSARV